MLNRFSKKISNPKMTSADEAYDKALELLSYHDFSDKAMIDRLKKKGATDGDAKEVVEKLNEYGILNEERYAERVYASWLNKGSYGRLHLQTELVKRSVRQDIISKILSGFTITLEEEHAHKAIEIFLTRNKKKIEQFGMNNPKIYGAAIRFLVTRGFSPRYIHILYNEMNLEDDI